MSGLLSCVSEVYEVYTNSNFRPALMNDEFDVTRIIHHTYDQMASDYSSMIAELVSDSWVGKFERGLLLFQTKVQPI